MFTTDRSIICGVTVNCPDHPIKEEHMSFLYTLAGIRTPVMNNIMLFISYLGTPYFFAAVFAWYYLNVNKRNGCGMALAFCFSNILCQGAKVLIRMPRPWNLDPSFSCVEGAASASTGYSLPSIHSQTAVSLGTSLIYLTKNTVWRIVCVIYMCLVMFSRMYLGVHTPLDVFVAFATSLIVTIVSWLVWNRHNRTFSEDGLIPFFLPAFALVLLIFTITLLANGTVDFSNAKDSISMGATAIGMSIGFTLEPRFAGFSVQGTFGKKVIRFLIAAVGSLVILEGIKAAAGTGTPVVIIRYMLSGLYLTFGAPKIAVMTGLCQTEMPQKKIPNI